MKTQYYIESFYDKLFFLFYNYFASLLEGQKKDRQLPIFFLLSIYEDHIPFCPFRPTFRSCLSL